MNASLAYSFSSIGKKALMAMSGALLGLFLLVHLLGIASAFMGRATFISYTAYLHSLGALIPVAEGLLAVILLLHVGLGLTLYFEDLGARPVRYRVHKAAGGRTLASRTMPYTGLVILAFLGLHVATFLRPTPVAASADLLRQALRGIGPVLFYLVSLLALCLHTSHGFWSLFQSLGLNHPHYDRFLRQGALFVSMLAGAVLMLVPLFVYFVHDFLL